MRSVARGEKIADADHPNLALAARVFQRPRGSAIGVSKSANAPGKGR
jgi:hypothetical protein